MKIEFDASAVLKNLAALADPVHSVARHMGVAVGSAMRDEAKANVNSVTGKLKSAMVLKYDGAPAAGGSVRYVVTWNRKKAPHGHLVEFGHRITHEVLRLPDGSIRTGNKLPPAEWRDVAAKPFLRPALGTVTPRALSIAVAAGSARWNQLALGGG